MKPRFSVPKLNKTKARWFAYFRYEGKLCVYKKGLNYEKDLKKREANFKLLCEALHKKLKEGWNPLLDEFDIYNSDLTIVKAVQFGLEKKKITLAASTYESYTTAINYFIDGVKALRMQNLLVVDTKRVHIKRILEKTKEIKGWSNKAYNKNMGYIKAVFGELLQWDIIEESPAYKIKKLKEEETEANRTPTEEEAVLIKNEILKKFPPFWVYVAVIFHTGIRPEELLAIQVGMINFETNTIKMPPEITKTDRYRLVPINQHLKLMLESMGVSKMPNDYFLFGTERQHRNRPITIDSDFIPAPNQLNRDCASTLWKKIVKKGLGIDVNLYAYKHYGADKKILADIPLEALSELYGHTSKLMTMRYARKVKEVYRKEIMAKSPDI